MDRKEKSMLLFPKREWQSLVDKSLHCKKLSEWMERKQRMGIMRCDLTQHLEKTVLGMPTVKAYKGEFPKKLVGLHELDKSTDRQAWEHNFLDDCRLDTLWLNEKRKLEQIRHKCAGMLSADFSARLDMSDNEIRYNLYRSHALAQIAQNMGIPTIMTLSWAGYNTFEYAFDGIEPGGIYAVSNVGAYRNCLSRRFFIAGLYEAVKRLNPKGLVVYGSPLNCDVGCDVRLFPNEHLMRVRGFRNPIS